MYARHKPVLFNARALEVISACRESSVKQYLLEDPSYILSLVSLNHDALQHVPEEVRSDKEFALQMLEANALAYGYLSEELKQDPDVILSAVQKDAEALQFISPELMMDFEFVYCLVTMNRHALEYAAPELQSDPELMAVADPLGWLRNDKPFVRRMVQHRGQALRSASWSLQRDPEIVLMAVKKDGLALEFAHSDLRSNYAMVKAAVMQDGLALAFADGGLNACAEIVRYAVVQNWAALQYASAAALAHKDIIVAASRQNARAISHAGPQLRGDREMMEYFVQKSGLNLQYASPELRGDPNLAFLALQENLESIEFMDEDLKNNPEFVKKLALLLPQKVQEMERAAERRQQQKMGRVSKFVRRLTKVGGGRNSCPVAKDLKKVDVSQDPLNVIKETLRRHGNTEPQRPARSSVAVNSAEEAEQEIRRRLSILSLDSNSKGQIQAQKDKQFSWAATQKDEGEAVFTKQSTIRKTRGEAAHPEAKPTLHRTLSQKAPAVRQRREEVYEFVREQQRAKSSRKISADAEEASSTAMVPFKRATRDEEDDTVDQDTSHQAISSSQKQPALERDPSSPILRFTSSAEGFRDEVRNRNQLAQASMKRPSSASAILRKDFNQSVGQASPQHRNPAILSQTSERPMSAPTRSMRNERSLGGASLSTMRDPGRSNQASIKCTACGSSLKPTAKFCSECGGKVNGTVQDGEISVRVKQLGSRPSSAGALRRNIPERASGAAPSIDSNGSTTFAQASPTTHGLQGRALVGKATPTNADGYRKSDPHPFAERPGSAPARTYSFSATRSSNFGALQHV